MSRIRTSLAAAALAALAALGCEEPRTNVSIPTLGPRILVANAPAGAELYVDGKPMGEARRYNGDPGVLQVEVGTHLVEVRQGGKVLRSEKLFFGGTEMRTITL